jgi:hypothetical protein
VADARQVGWREVLLVAAVAVAIVLGIDVITTKVPGLQDLVTRTPLFIGLLLVGTGGLLWWLASRRPPEI